MPAAKDWPVEAAVHLRGERLRLSREGRRDNPWRILLYLVFIFAGVLIVRLRETGRVQPLFAPTPIPTRTAFSYAEEGAAQFSAGDLAKAISAYQQATSLAPDDARVWAELTRVQTYSSELRTSHEEKRIRMADARRSADRAVEANPDDGVAWAIRALVYDWSAALEAPDSPQKEAFLREADASVNQASRLDPGSPLVVAVQAEVALDQLNFVRALDLAAQAAQAVVSEPDYPWSMDVHRIYGTVLESNGLYRQAIEEYARAAEFSPNLTFLYLRIGTNYRQLRDIDRALENFARAAQINEQLKIEDPVPYLAIGKTYLQQGEFFIAARNMERALVIDPSDPDLYGRLGIVYFKARNYESAIPVLKCAVLGCGPEESGRILCPLEVYGCDPDDPETNAASYGEPVSGLALGPSTVEYYYTYGSALTFYAGSEDYPDACQKAERVFQELMAVFGEDAIVKGIVAEGRAVCAAAGTPAPSQTPEATPTTIG